MNKLRDLKFLVMAIIMTVFVAGVSNAAVTAKEYKLIANNLSIQIQNDLSDAKPDIKVIRAEDMQISAKQEILFGDAMYLAKGENKPIPIYFEVIVDSNSRKATSVDYTFVENGSNISDNFLEKLLIKKIGNDYKTEAIMVSVGNIEKVAEQENAEKFRGVGEAKIGSFVMKKVKFEIVLENGQEKVLYKLDEL